MGYFSSEEKIRRKGWLEHENVSGPALNYNEGRRNLVMASLEYIIIALLCGAERGEEVKGGNERDIKAINNLR